MCYMAAYHLPLVKRLVDLLKQPVTSKGIQGSGEITSLEVPPIDMAQIVSFVNGKHEVLSIH